MTYPRVFAFLLSAIGIVFISPTCVRASTLPSGFYDSTYVSGLAQPVAFDFAPDGRIFVTEKGGLVRVVKNGTLLATPFVQVAVDTAKERGLLGITLDPKFSQNGYVYVYYTLASTSKSRVSRFTASVGNPDVADTSSEKVLLDSIPSESGNHNGGAVHFGKDGNLYVSVGDNGTGSNAQDLSTLAGKLLRITKDGSVPTDNPFITRPGARGEIYAYGLRNPFTFAVDPSTGKIFINDVGENSFEEIDELHAGLNYGWPQCEGNCSLSSTTNPLYVYDHSVGHSIAGGAFNETAQLGSAYIGSYFYSDYVNNFIKRLDASGNSVDFASGIAGPVDLKMGPDGNLYYLSITKGLVGKIQYGAGLKGYYFPTVDFSGTPLERIDANINFDWGGGGPMQNFPADNFSVRWQGTILPQYSEVYTFYARSDDGVRVWVNNALIIDRFVDQAATESVGTISLTANQKYDIKVEYYERGGQAVSQLSWSSTSQPKEIIPQSRLFSDTATSTPPASPAPAPSPSPMPTPSPTPSPMGSSVTIYAAGQPAQGVYPQLQLTVNDQLVATFSNITGDADNRVFQTFTYTSTNALSIGQLKLQYSNDLYVGPGQDRNVRVDKVILDGATYEAESPTTYSTGTWDGSSCNGGYKKSEWLHCGGYFSFSGVSEIPTPAPTPTPTPSPAPTPAPQPNPSAQTSTIKIFAAGQQAQGIYPTLALTINGTAVKTFDDIRGDADARVFQEYSYSQSTPIDIANVKLQYTNDLYVGPGQDRNVRVDKVILDGIPYETESPQTYSTGTWSQDSNCAPGKKQSEWLHCGGYLQYK